ncbi:MAG: AMP-binding protein [Akkermansiaceae bacterium]|nr:AMP-binding protein [Akkermansiaceae bacterium]
MTRRRTTWWETASPDEVAHRQTHMLTRYLRERVVPFCAHYRAMFDSLGMDARDIRTLEDFATLPFTSKRDFDNPRDFVIIPDEAQLARQWSSVKLALRHGRKGARERLADELRPILMTSTTGRSSTPVPFLHTKHDLERLTIGGRRLMELARADASWRHINAFPFAPHLAFWQAHQAGLGFTTFVMSTGGGKTMGTDGNIRLISKIDPDAIIAMPTFLYHLLQEAAAEGLKWTKLKRLVLGGEKVPKGMRRKLTELCSQVGANEVGIISTYGFTEAKVAWSECVTPSGAASCGFHVYADMGLVEVIDPESGEPLADGQPGEVVYTPIDARGTIVLRYRTGDLIEGGLVREPCPNCGRTCPRLVGRISRVSDIRRLQIGKIKGTLVDFNALENILDDARGLGAWQIELRKRNDDPLDCDQIIVHAVAMESDHETLRETINDCFHATAEFTPNEIHFHDWEEMRRLQGVGKELKEKKVADNRPREDDT